MLEEDMQALREAIQQVGVAAVAVANSLGKALSQGAALVGSRCTEAIRSLRIAFCHQIPSRVKHLAYNHKDPRVRKKNLKRINKILEEYYG